MKTLLTLLLLIPSLSYSSFHDSKGNIYYDRGSFCADLAEMINKDTSELRIKYKIELEQTIELPQNKKLNVIELESNLLRRTSIYKIFCE